MEMLLLSEVHGGKLISWSPDTALCVFWVLPRNFKAISKTKKVVSGCHVGVTPFISLENGGLCPLQNTLWPQNTFLSNSCQNNKSNMTI